MIRIGAKTRSRSGFTIVELAIVIVVISILAAVFISRFTFAPAALTAARAKLINDIRYAQSLAVNRGGTFGVEFLTASETYGLYEGGATTKIKDPEDPDTDFIVNYSTDPKFSSVEIVSASFGGSSNLEFDWQGTPCSGGGGALVSDGTVVLNNSSGSTTVTVETQTGRVSY